MILVAKMSSIAYAYEDGHTDRQLTSRQQKYKLEQLPSVVELIGYTNIPIGCVIGPFFEYKDFLDYLHQRHDFENPPFPVGKFIYKAFMIVFTMVTALQLGKVYPMEWFSSDDFAS